MEVTEERETPSQVRTNLNTNSTNLNTNLNTTLLKWTFIIRLTLLVDVHILLLNSTVLIYTPKPKLQTLNLKLTNTVPIYTRDITHQYSTNINTSLYTHVYCTYITAFCECGSARFCDVHIRYSTIHSTVNTHITNTLLSNALPTCTDTLRT